MRITVTSRSATWNSNCLTFARPKRFAGIWLVRASGHYNTGLFVQPMYKNDFAPAAIQLHLNWAQHVNTTEHLKMAALVDTYSEASRPY